MDYSVKQAGQGLLYVYFEGTRTAWGIMNTGGKWTLYNRVGAGGRIVYDLGKLIHHPKELSIKIGELITNYERAVN